MCVNGNIAVCPVVLYLAIHCYEPAMIFRAKHADTVTLETLCVICALLALCLGNLPVTSGFPHKGPGYSEMLWCISAFFTFLLTQTSY